MPQLRPRRASKRYSLSCSPPDPLGFMPAIELNLSPASAPAPEPGRAPTFLDQRDPRPTERVGCARNFRCGFPVVSVPGFDTHTTLATLGPLVSEHGHRVYLLCGALRDAGSERDQSRTHPPIRGGQRRAEA